MLRDSAGTLFMSTLNIVVKTINANGINNLMNQVGIDIDAFGVVTMVFTVRVTHWPEVIPISL